MNWKTLGVTALATLTLTACGNDDGNETGQGLNNGVNNVVNEDFNDNNFPGRNVNNPNFANHNDDLGINPDNTDGHLNYRDRGINQNVADGHLNRDNNQGINNQANNYRENGNGMDYEVGERAADAISKQVNEVDRVYVLTSENNAYVAAELDNDNNRNGEQLNRGEVSDKIEQDITRAVKSVNNDIENVYVTTNPDFVNLSNNYVNDINNGEPVEGFFNQIGEAIDRVFPDVR